jgi:hypothetical protein
VNTAFGAALHYNLFATELFGLGSVEVRVDADMGVSLYVATPRVVGTRVEYTRWRQAHGLPALPGARLRLHVDGTPCTGDIVVSVVGDEKGTWLYRQPLVLQRFTWVERSTPPSNEREAAVDEFMRTAQISYRSKYNWCGPTPNDPPDTNTWGCACMGCVNRGGQLAAAGFEYADWEAWAQRHPQGKYVIRFDGGDFYTQPSYFGGKVVT